MSRVNDDERLFVLRICPLQYLIGNHGNRSQYFLRLAFPFDFFYFPCSEYTGKFSCFHKMDSPQPQKHRTHKS